VNAALLVQRRSWTAAANSLDYARRGNETERARHKTGGAEACVTVNAQISDVSLRAADRAVLLCEDERLRREYTLHAELFFAAREAMPRAQKFPDLAQQPVVTAESEIRNFNGCWIAPSARSAGGDDGDLLPAAERDEKTFQRNAVNGVENVVEVRCEDFFGVGFEKEFLTRVDLTIRIDGAHAFGHDFDLGLPKRAGERVKLAVGVADADIVEINQRELSDAGTSERLDAPRTHAADADDAHVGQSQSFRTRGAEQSPDAAESGFM
jgi:hypothetical protein